MRRNSFDCYIWTYLNSQNGRGRKKFKIDLLGFGDVGGKMKFKKCTHSLR